MPRINVERPVTHSSWEDKKYTTYDIRIDCIGDSCPLFNLLQSVVSRRYSEFQWLRKRLRSICSSVDVPQLPPSVSFFTDKFSPDFIEKRRVGLEEFIRNIFAIPTLLSEAIFHLFAQTDLSPAEIDAYINGEWGKHMEVADVICDLNQKKVDEEREDISSIASCSRWSDLSYLHDLDDVSPNASSLDDDGRLNIEPSPRDSVLSPITGLYVPANASDFLSPAASLDRTSSGFSSLHHRRAHDLRNESNEREESSSRWPPSRFISVPTDKRRQKMYCSNAVMYSSSLDDRRHLTPTRPRNVDTSRAPSSRDADGQ